MELHMKSKELRDISMITRKQIEDLQKDLMSAKGGTMHAMRFEYYGGRVGSSTAAKQRPNRTKR